MLYINITYFQHSPFVWRSMECWYSRNWFLCYENFEPTLSIPFHLKSKYIPTKKNQTPKSCYFEQLSRGFKGWVNISRISSNAIKRNLILNNYVTTIEKNSLKSFQLSNIDISSKMFTTGMPVIQYWAYYTSSCVVCFDFPYGIENL